MLLAMMTCSAIGFAQSSTEVIMKTTEGAVIKVDTVQPVVKHICCAEKKDSPLVLLNGSVISMVELGKVPVNSIQSIDILNPAEAVKKYGRKAKNGVMSLTAKPEAVDDLIKQGLIKPIL